MDAVERWKRDKRAGKIAITTEKTGVHRVIAEHSACSALVRLRPSGRREVRIRVHGKGPKHSRFVAANLIMWVVRSYHDAFINHQTAHLRSWRWTGPCVSASIQDGDRIIIGASVHRKGIRPPKR